jgi:hypothetical protein
MCHELSILKKPSTAELAENAEKNNAKIVKASSLFNGTIKNLCVLLRALPKDLGLFAVKRPFFNGTANVFGWLAEVEFFVMDVCARDAKRKEFLFEGLQHGKWSAEIDVMVL